MTEQQAEQFIVDLGLRVVIRADSDGYLVTIWREGFGKVRVAFGPGSEPTPADILVRLPLAQPPPFARYCTQYGYDPQTAEARGYYRGEVLSHKDTARVLGAVGCARLRELRGR